MHANIRGLGSLLISLFALVGVTLGFWQFLKAPELESASNNPRLIEEAARVVRGSLLDRKGRPIAESEQTPNGVVRRYLLAAASPVTGYHSLRFGNTGIEAAFDEQLRGERSPDLAARLNREFRGLPTVGSDVVLTIDADVQRTATEALGDANGAIVVLDPRSGAVLALATRPYFDPGLVNQQWEQLRNDPRRPLFNRATQATYVPGSTFKTLVAAAAADLGVVDVDREFSCTRPAKIGELAPDCKNHAHLPVVDFIEALAWSCNRTFALTALGLGMQGPLNLSDDPPQPYPWEERGIQPSVEKLTEYAGRFGFGKPIPFDIPVEPSRLRDADQEFFPSLLAQTGFGQGQVAATPIQMALVGATIANAGIVPQPFLVTEVRAPSGAISTAHQPGGRLGRAVSKEAAATVNRALELSVEVAYGQKARIPGVKVAGKTGTAEVGQGREPNAWFIGYAPSESPRVAIAVVLENRGSGSDTATPAAQRVLKAALEAYNPDR